MDDTTKVLLNFLRSHFEASEKLTEAWEKAPALTLMHLSRPGWPAASFRPEQKFFIEKELRRMAQQCSYANDMKSLLKFAQHAVGLVLRQASSKSSTEVEKGRLLGFIRAEQMDGLTGVAAAGRAAARFLQTKRLEHRGKTYIQPDESNHLLEVLSLPKSIGAELPKQDIRGLILKSPLAPLLKQASCFSPQLLRTVLGEDLSQQITPVGFADKLQRTILIQVRSSALAHELSYRKLEILSRLRQLKAFEQVTDVRFSI